MKKIMVGLASVLFFWSGIAKADTFSPAELTPSLKFEAHLENDGVMTSWTEWTNNFMWYKLSRSQSNANPIYPEDGAIFWSTSAAETTFFDVDPPHGKSFYRICAITHAKERFCSNVVAIENNVSENEIANTEVENETTKIETKDIVTNEETKNAVKNTESEDEALLCAQVVTLAKNPETEECRQYPTPCDVPEGWTTETSCGEKSITLLAEQKEESIMLSWQTEGGLSSNGFQLIKSEVNSTPSFPPEEEDEPNVWLMAGNRAFTDNELKKGRSYSYRICEYIGKDECGVFSNAVTIFVPSENGLLENLEISFSDIDEDTEVGSAILKFAQKGVVRGFDDGTFQPEKAVTRAELAKMTTLATGRIPNTVKDALFCDVNPEEWYAPYIHFFVENGFAKGFEEGECDLGKTFAPHNPVKRNEAIKMILGVTGKSSVEKADDWFQDYFLKAVEREIISSDNREDFDEMREATRGEIMLFLDRAIQK